MPLPNGWRHWGSNENNPIFHGLKTILVTRLLAGVKMAGDGALIRAKAGVGKKYLLATKLSTISVGNFVCR